MAQRGLWCSDFAKGQDHLIMPVLEPSHVSNRRRRPFVIFIFIALFFGLVGFFRVMQSPRFESYRTVDVIQLVVSGASFGVALFGLMVWLLRPHCCPFCGEARGRIGTR